MKNGSCPSGVTVAPPSHSTWMRPAKVSVTTGPADTRSTTGCSPVRSPGKSPRFLLIPHDNSDLPNRRNPPTHGFRINRWNSVARRQGGNLHAAAGEEIVGRDEEGI